MIHIVVCDDEKIFALKACYCIQKIFDETKQECEIHMFLSGDELIDKVNQTGFFFDILFMDIDMPGENGIEAAKILREKSKEFILIFLSHIEEAVFETFKTKPFRFVRKNKMEEELQEALLKAAEEISYQNAIIEFKTKDMEMIAIKPNDIIYFQVFNRRIYLYAVNQKRYELLTGGIAKYEEKFADIGFMRVGKSHLVNIRYIDSICTKNIGMKGGAEISLGRDKKRVEIIKKKYYQYLKEKA